MTLNSWLSSWLDSTTCQHMGTALLHFMWQATTLCVIVVGLTGLLRTRSSQFRYALYVTCLTSMAVCVPANLAILGRLETSRQNDVAGRLSTERDRTPASQRRGAGPASSSESSLSESSLSKSSSSKSSSIERSSTNTERQSSYNEGRQPPTNDSRISVAISPPLSSQIGASVMGRTGPHNHFASWLVAIWGAGAAVMLTRLFVALLAGWKLAFSARPIKQDSLLPLAQAQAERIGLMTQPVLAWCEGVSVPMVLGILRPMVLLPPSLATGLSSAQLEAILAHEFAHVRRLDPLVNVIQRVVESLLFFHPAIWYMSRLISDERENCCDDMVIAKSTNRLGYADALVRMAELCVEERVPVTSLAATGRNQSDLKRRILRLFVAEPSLRPASSFTMVVAVALAAAALIAHGAMLMADDPDEETKTHQQVAGQPDDLVAVLGEDRARIWGYTKQILVTGDEQRLFVTESIGYVSIFDANTLKRIAQFRPHEKRCLDIALLDSDTRLITISVDGTARLWDVTKETPERLDTFVAFDGTKEPAWLSMSVANQGRRAAIRSETQITILEARQNKLHVLTSIPNRGSGTTFTYVLSPDGRWLVACEDQETRELVKDEFGNMNFYVDAILAVWDLQGEEPVVVSELKRKTVQQLHMSPDGKSLFGVDPGFVKGEAYVEKKETHHWILDGGQILEEVEPIPGRATVFGSTVWNSSGTRMAFGTDKGVQVLTKRNGNWKPLKEPMKTGANAACAFLGDNSLIVARAPEIQRWDLVDGTYRKRPGPKGHSAAVMGIMFDSRTNSLLSAGSDALREWSLEDMSSTVRENNALAFDDVVKMWPWEKKGFLLRRSVDGANVIEGVRRSGKRMVSQFKLDFTSDYRQSAWCAVMHPTEEILATGHWDSRIRVWDVAVNPPEKLLEWEAHRGHVCDVAFSPDGTQIASVGWDNLTYVWSIESLDQKEQPKRQRMGKHLDIVRSVAWSSNGRYLASGGEDGQILLWDMKNGLEKSLTHVEDGPVKQNHYDSKTVDTLQFNRDGTQLLSGDGKGRVTVWRMKDFKIEKRWLLSGWIWDAKFSPDEKMIATANYDGTVYLLRSPTP